jgi:hypothetical protein
MTVACVKDLIDESNHPLAAKDLDSLLHSHRRITDEEKAYIIEMGFLGFEAPYLGEKQCQLTNNFSHNK